MFRYLAERNTSYIGHNRIDYIGCDDNKVYVLINNKEHVLKQYFRYYRTWDDHMGNTPCGTYVNLPLPFGKKVRAYLY